MIMMTTYDNDNINETINNKDFIFQKEMEKKEMKLKNHLSILFQMKFIKN